MQGLDFSLHRSIRSQQGVSFTNIKLNKNTTFKGTFDVSKISPDKFYIWLEEILPCSPFYYDGIFTLDELRDINRVFRCVDSLEEVKEHFNRLFNERRIELKQEDFDEGEIQLILNSKIFLKEEKIIIPLKRVIDPLEEAKRKKLGELYIINKKGLLLIKDFYQLLMKNNQNINNINKKDEFKNKINNLSNDIQLYLNNDNRNITMNLDNNDDDIIPNSKKIYKLAYKGYYNMKYQQEDNICPLKLINMGEETWPEKSITIECDRNKSDAVPYKAAPMDDFYFQVSRLQDIEYILRFKGLTLGKKKCLLKIKYKNNIVGTEEITLNVQK